MTRAIPVTVGYLDVFIYMLIKVIINDAYYKSCLGDRGCN